MATANHALLAFDIRKGTTTTDAATAVRTEFEKRLIENGWSRVKVHSAIDTTFTKVTADDQEAVKNRILAMFLLSEKEKNVNGSRIEMAVVLGTPVKTYAFP